ncbi:MAG: succinate dehydrogenase [Desulfobulbus sp.]|nr:MAG: succinate dehydrogenase [Desulfobulbus sp.]RUM36677.1 MAG: succinate dehydrogenase [Desulfobulbus sp.]
MSWFSQAFSSSLGKKYIMAVTGLMLGGFLLVHAAGNSSIFWGRHAFIGYAEHLHALGPLIPVAEFILLSIFLLHVVTGIQLFLANLQARSERYAVSTPAGGRTLGSKTMPYTGALILSFILLHLYNVRFTDQSVPVADIVNNVLSQPVYTLLYATGILVLALHVSHGFWSLFQTLGMNHPRYDRIIRIMASLVCAVIIAVFLVILFLLFSNSSLLA